MGRYEPTGAEIAWPSRQNRSAADQVIAHVDAGSPFDLCAQIASEGPTPGSLNASRGVQIAVR